MMRYLIKNATIVDGTGSEPYLGECLTGDHRILSVIRYGDHQKRDVTEPERISGDGVQIIDASGHYLTPGFIDVHRHADTAVFRPSFGEAELRQGLTTVINGNCGLSAVPCPKPYGDEIKEFLSPVVGGYPENMTFTGFPDYLDAIPKELPLNVGMLIGNGTVRSAVAGYRAGRLSDEEMSRVQGLLTEAVDAGAFGVSIGLQYAPEMYYDTKELIRSLEPMRGEKCSSLYTYKR